MNIFEYTEEGFLQAREWLNSDRYKNADGFSIVFTANNKIEALIKENAPEWAKCIIFQDGNGYYSDTLPHEVTFFGSTMMCESGISIPQKEEIIYELHCSCRRA